MISGGEQRFKKKARSLGSGALSREDVHGTAYNVLYRFFDQNKIFNRIGFEQMTWVVVTCFLCIGVLGFSWFFFFGGNVVDSSTMMALNLEMPFDKF